jgi:hypothetical protein
MTGIAWRTYVENSRRRIAGNPHSGAWAERITAVHVDGF